MKKHRLLNIIELIRKNERMLKRKITRKLLNELHFISPSVSHEMNDITRIKDKENKSKNKEYFDWLGEE